MRTKKDKKEKKDKKGKKGSIKGDIEGSVKGDIEGDIEGSVKGDNVIEWKEGKEGKEGKEEKEDEEEKKVRKRKEVEEYISRYVPFIRKEINKKIKIRDELLNNNKYIQFHIFAIWFLSHMEISVENIDFYEIYMKFNNFPFYCVMNHILNDE